MKIAKIEILRRMCGVTRKNRIRNEYIKISLNVTNIFGKLRENRLRLF